MSGYQSSRMNPVFTTASLLVRPSGSSGMLIAARAVQSTKSAMLAAETLSMTMATRLVPSKRRSVAMSVWVATADVGSLVGPLTGGLLVAALGWEWIFLIVMRGAATCQR
jgi:MFS family permease